MKPHHASARCITRVRLCALPLLLASLLAGASDTARVDVGRFSEGRLAGWQEKQFTGKTHYDIVLLDARQVLRADSQNAASGLYRKQRIDLEQTPWLNWSWRIDHRLDTRDEQVRSGDDYAGRIYVVISGGLKFWKTRALNYVWASASEKFETWPNAFVGDHAMMMALRSGSDDLSTWHTEKRNVREDLKALFGEEIRYIDAIALMSDTDNTHGKVTAWYGDIFFTAD